MNEGEANAVRAAIDKLPGNDKRVLISDVYEARDILLSLLDASQPDDTAAHLQARIDAAIADIAFMVGGYSGAANIYWTSKLTRIAHILKGEQP